MCAHDNYFNCKKLMYTMGVWFNKPSNGDSELNNQYYYP